MTRPPVLRALLALVILGLSAFYASPRSRAWASTCAAARPSPSRPRTPRRRRPTPRRPTAPSRSSGAAWTPSATPSRRSPGPARTDHRRAARCPGLRGGRGGGRPDRAAHVPPGPRPGDPTQVVARSPRSSRRRCSRRCRVRRPPGSAEPSAAPSATPGAARPPPLAGTGGHDAAGRRPRSALPVRCGAERRPRCCPLSCPTPSPGASAAPEVGEDAEFDRASSRRSSTRTCSRSGSARPP
jgi:hypothetical protein